LLDVAEATEALEVADVAQELVIAADQNKELRLEAMMYVVRFCGPIYLRRLAVPIGEGSGETGIELRLRGLLILELLRQDIWPVWRAARFAPQKETSPCLTGPRSEVGVSRYFATAGMRISQNTW
jgi:hypothetical protein